MAPAVTAGGTALGGSTAAGGGRTGELRQAGFTLFEMMAVLAILGLVLSLLAAQPPARSARLELDGTARSLVQSLQLARARAIAANHSVAVTISPAGHRRDGQAPQPFPPGIRAIETGIIRFAPDGSASGGALTLRGEGGAVQVSVAWLTGRVTTQALR
ncbi:general secretion pathway protein H [Belnapia rosea]|uniref:Type II secretion system protein H n=1 Tax=Belnapia rosea TaxID=938405 RepID=A0A1G7DRL8_9PROT|nr:general secretion pathway protein H [Belnapia rosea]SDE54082.1 general secretion pathway protein H [Belnapia rosea]